jgi:hypothetical protein
LVQLFSQISFVTVAVLVVFGLGTRVLHMLCAAKSLRRRFHVVDLGEDVLLGIEEAITLIRAERQSGISQN